MNETYKLRRIVRNGSTLVAGAENGKIHVYRLGLDTRRGHADSVITALIAPDGRYGVTAASDSSFRIWDLSSGDLVRDIDTFLGSGSSPCAITPDSQQLVAGGQRGELGVWDLASGRQLRSAQGT